MPNLPAVREMRIYKYIPDGLYGFALDEIGQVFFHLGVFDPGETPNRYPRCTSCSQPGCNWGVAPPPVLGELVEVVVSGFHGSGEAQAPRAERVRRITTPLRNEGTVDTFDATRGFGWVLDPDGNSYHLHRSEITDGRVPVLGQRVMFYAGTRMEKPRACHVRICS